MRFHHRLERFANGDRHYGFALDIGRFRFDWHIWYIRPV